jgi:hypothetical protein
MSDRYVIRLLVALGFIAAVLFSIVINEIVAADGGQVEGKPQTSSAPD